MPLRKMTVANWIKVQDNPIQRDTERHAAKAKHLLTPLAIHAIVYAAELPDGKLIKLDGHTRALLWARNQVRHPAEVECHVIPVKDIEEAKRLYQTLDSKDALESVRDKVSGAFHEQNFAPESGLLKGGNIANALRMAWNIRQGFGYRGGAPTGDPSKQFNIYAAVREFSNEIFALDAFQSSKFSPTSGIVAAFILTNRRHGIKVLPFWQAVFADGGEKKAGRMDGVQALVELILARKGKFGGTATADICSRAIMCAEKWLADEDFGTSPRPYDLTGYIDMSKPAIQLIKAKPAK